MFWLLGCVAPFKNMRILQSEPFCCSYGCMFSVFLLEGEIAAQTAVFCSLKHVFFQYRHVVSSDQRLSQTLILPPLWSMICVGNDVTRTTFSTCWPYPHMDWKQVFLWLSFDSGFEFSGYFLKLQGFFCLIR